MIPVLEAWLADVPWMTLLVLFIDITLKGALVCAMAAIAALVFRRSSAFVRSTIWVFALVGLLLLPAFSLQSPVWNVPLLPELTSWGAGSYTPEIEKPESEAAGTTLATQADAQPAVGAVGSTTETGLPWYAWGILAWIAGGLLYLTWYLISHASVRAIVRQATPADGAWTRMLHGVSEELELRRKVRLLESDRIKAAITVGILDPAIVIPSGCDDWSASRRRLVLSHELAHVKRWDTLTETFALVAMVLYWFNPLVWFAVKQLRIERETDCDNAVLQTGAKPSDYAELLMNIASDMSTSAKPMWELSTISQSSNLKDRLMDILNQKMNRGKGSRRSAVITGVLALALVLPISALSIWNSGPLNEAVAQTEDKSDEVKKSQHEQQEKQMTDEEKKAKKMAEKEKWDKMTGAEKAASMMEKVCSNEMSAACKVGKVMKHDGIDAGVKAFQKMKQAENSEYVFKEKEFNSLGYAFLWVEKADHAIAVFELNVKEYPESWNCYDSLGEAYLVAKEYNKSVKYYEKAVAMNPDSEHSKKQLEKLRVLVAESS